MSMSIGSTSAPMQTTGLNGANVNPASKEAWLGLTSALKNGDLEAAKESYAALVKNAPEGATFTRGSPFAQMGKALIKGDLEAAKAAYATMVRNRLDDTGTKPPHMPSEPMPPGPVVTSSTGGSAGSMLNVSA